MSCVGDDEMTEDDGLNLMKHTRQERVDTNLYLDEQYRVLSFDSTGNLRQPTYPLIEDFVSRFRIRMAFLK